MFYTGQHTKKDGALVGMKGGQYPIVCAAAVVEDETSDQLIIVVINQAACTNKDVKQHESLLDTDQARLHGVKINELASCFKDGHGHNEKQSMEAEGKVIPLLHDGSKYYLNICEPTNKESDM